MKQDNTLSPKEIKEGMSPTPWNGCHDGKCKCGLLWDNDGAKPIGTTQVGNEFIPVPENERMANSLSIITAVNNTYGKGLNPEVYEDVVKIIEMLLDYPHEDLEAWSNGNTPITCTFLPIHFKQALETLNKSRI